jgi:hypothetical protein
MSLLTYSQQQAIKPISENNQDKFAQLEKEVENKELTKLLGVDFLQDIQNDPESYDDILDEHEFINVRGNSIIHKGLRYVIAYMVFSKYIGESMVEDTFSGFVIKQRQDAQTIQEGTIRRLQEDNRQLALMAWQTIKEFINKNSDDYPNWTSSYKKIYRPIFRGIKKINYGR